MQMLNPLETKPPQICEFSNTFRLPVQSAVVGEKRRQRMKLQFPEHIRWRKRLSLMEKLGKPKSFVFGNGLHLHAVSKSGVIKENQVERCLY